MKTTIDAILLQLIKNALKTQKTITFLEASKVLANDYDGAFECILFLVKKGAIVERGEGVFSLVEKVADDDEAPSQQEMVKEKDDAQEGKSVFDIVIPQTESAEKKDSAKGDQCILDEILSQQDASKDKDKTQGKQAESKVQTTEVILDVFKFIAENSPFATREKVFGVFKQEIIPYILNKAIEDGLVEESDDFLFLTIDFDFLEAMREVLHEEGDFFDSSITIGSVDKVMALFKDDTKSGDHDAKTVSAPKDSGNSTLSALEEQINRAKKSNKEGKQPQDHTTAIFEAFLFKNANECSVKICLADTPTKVIEKAYEQNGGEIVSALIGQPNGVIDISLIDKEGSKFFLEEDKPEKSLAWDVPLCKQAESRIINLMKQDIKIRFSAQIVLCSK